MILNIHLKDYKWNLIQLFNQNKQFALLILGFVFLRQKQLKLTIYEMFQHFPVENRP